MGAVGEDKFKGRRISYCATCDAAFFEGLHVYVIGGGDTAVEEAGFISNFARKITIVHRRDELRAAKSIQEKAFNNPKIDFIWDSVVDEVRGNQRIESFILRNRFFEDICTINEIHAIAQRLQVAKLLSERKTYSEIEKLTNASTATISRINKCIVYGADGYRRVLERLEAEKKKK